MTNTIRPAIFLRFSLPPDGPMAALSGVSRLFGTSILTTINVCGVPTSVYTLKIHHFRMLKNDFSRVYTLDHILDTRHA